jgi:hypothetical protein
MTYRRLFLLMCAACLLLGSCVPEDNMTTSGSDQWSRGSVLDTTPFDTVALTTWEGSNFAAWVADDGHIRLARLDHALQIESLTDLELDSEYPGDMSLLIESAHRVHLIWEDRLDGTPAVVHAIVTPDQTEPILSQEILLPDDSQHIQTVLQLDGDRLEIFWSDLSGRNSGVFHQAYSITGGPATPVVQLTEGGWQPGVAVDASGAIYIAWIETLGSSRLTIQHALFEPESQTLSEITHVTTQPDLRGTLVEGPIVARIDTQTVVAWSTGQRLVQSGFFDQAGDGNVGRIDGGRMETGTRNTNRTQGDSIQYVTTSPAQVEPPEPLNIRAGQVIGAWKAPDLLTGENRVWAIYSGWVEERGNTRLQAAVTPIYSEGFGPPIIISRTWEPSLRTTLALAEDESLRAAWLEATGEDMFKVVVASTDPTARAALGGFRPAEVMERATFIWSDFVGLLFFAPYIIAWMVLPWGLVGVGTILNPDTLEGLRSWIWLWLAPPIHLLCKRYIAPQWAPLGPSLTELSLTVAPLVVGALLMLIYLRRADRPSLLKAYGWFAIVDGLFTLFVTLPLYLWG